MGRISRANFLLRQAVLNYAAPYGLRAITRMTGLAETRARRSAAVERYCRGTGIEIGAAVNPAIVPVGTEVLYVDRFDEGHIEADPDLAGYDSVKTDIQTDAETLDAIGDDSYDFVLAFSLLEHVEDVLGSLKNFNRVCRDGGHIIVSIPDKRYYTPDRDRPLTSFAHFKKDYKDGGASSRTDHFRENGKYARKLSGAALEEYVQSSIDDPMKHTHFHVWNGQTFLDTILKARDVLKLNYQVVEFAQYGHEALAVLSVHKTDKPW